jgi:hypothetical protein
MIGPAKTDLTPAEGMVSGERPILTTRPRIGRTAAFSKCEVIITGDRSAGTIDTGKDTVEFGTRNRG